MAGRIKQYPSRRQMKKGVRVGPKALSRMNPEVGPSPHVTRAESRTATKRVKDQLTNYTKTNTTRKMHDPMKELTKLFKGMHSGGGGGGGVSRWHKDPKTGRRTLKVM